MRHSTGYDHYKRDIKKYFWISIIHRNGNLNEQLAELQRGKAVEVEKLKGDILEKSSLIEYLQNQVTPGASEKKKRRFFQPKPANSPSKDNGDAINNADSDE